jgi:3-phosphoshikimate 1-carboxyvinyltransferase
MDRVAAPLTLMGASVSGDGKRVLPPLTIAGRKNLVGITYRTPVPSAQVKSAIMFAGLSAMSPTSIAEETRTRDTTERMMRLAGLDVETHQSDDGQVVTVHPGRPKPTDWLVPGDPSQAAYWIVGSLLATNGDVSMSNIDVSPERIGFLSVLERMGANISFGQNGQIRALSSILKGTVIHSREIPSVDEVPILVVAAAAASGMTHFIDMDELRHKESDRFEQSVRLARSVGCAVTVDGDDFIIEGVGNAENFESFEFSSTLDHRMIMAAAIAGAVGRGVTLEGIEAVSSSYPNFFDVLQTVRS